MERIAWDLSSGKLIVYRKPRPPVNAQLSFICKSDDLDICYKTIAEGLTKVSASRAQVRSTLQAAQSKQVEETKHKPGPKDLIEDELGKLGEELASRRKADETKQISLENGQRSSLVHKHPLFVNRPTLTPRCQSRGQAEPRAPYLYLPPVEVLGKAPCRAPVAASSEYSPAFEISRLQEPSLCQRRDADYGRAAAQRTPIKPLKETSTWHDQEPIRHCNRLKESASQLLNSPAKPELRRSRSPLSPTETESWHRQQRTPRSPPCVTSNFSCLDQLLKQEATRRGIGYCLAETFKGGRHRVEISLNGFKVSTAEDSNLSLAKGIACLNALKSIDERLTQRLSLN
jgi:hypothetical protein